ncbi:putative ribonuclease H-like domain-containing protein [Tanacetum coccineum]
MQEELLQFKLQQVWTLVDLPYDKRAIGTKWVYRNKKDERVARIESIRLFLAYASFKDFVVYQMDVKSAFLYGKIEEEVYVCQPLGFEDPEFPDKVYKVEKALYSLHQAPRAWYETLSTYLLDNGFQRGQIDKTLTSMTPKDDGIFISKDKFVDEILKKFGLSTVKTASTPMETSKPLLKDAEAKDVDVHLYRSMIGSLMYLTTSRHDIMFVKQTALAISTIEAGYISVGKECQQALWMKQALIDYDIRLDVVLIMCDNKGTIDLSKNPVQQSRTKHIKIRHHFLRDNFQKENISIEKVSSEDNIVYILTKPLKRESFNYLRLGLGMMEHIM